MNPSEPDSRVGLESIPAAAANVSLVSRQPDSLTKEEQTNWERARKEAQVRSLNQDIDERKRYAAKSFWLVCGWLGLVLLIIVLQGFGGAGTELKIGAATLKFKLSEGVVIALIGATTINVIGLFVVVVKYLFPAAADSLRIGENSEPK